MHKFLASIFYIVGFIAIWYLNYFTQYTYEIYIVFILLYMLSEWFAINTRKNSLLFFSGIVYMVIPMIYWMFYKKVEVINLFVCIIFIYNLLAFLILIITDGMIMKNNRKLFKIIVNTISYFLISLFYLFYKTRTNNDFTILKGYVATISLLLTIILFISDMILTKVKMLIKNNCIIAEQSTDNILQSYGFGHKIVSNFLFVSYIWIILSIIVKYLYR